MNLPNSTPGSAESPRILCLDAGNSRLKWGLGDSFGHWLDEGALDYGQLEDWQVPEATCGVLANVAGDGVAKRIADHLAAHHLPLETVAPRLSRCGVRNSYDKPARLGADRWAALIGARSQYMGPCLVVMAGTATTVDYLDQDGVFQGGLILPGLELMRRALASNTAQLGPESGCLQALPRNTADAIMSGSLQAQAGAIERQFRPIAKLNGALCLIGGGAAPAIAPLLDIPYRLEPRLVLEGLLRLGLRGN